MIVDVESTRSIRQDEVRSVRTMLGRVEDRFGLHPESLIADAAYGSGPMLDWIVKQNIKPHIPVLDQADVRMAHGPALTLIGTRRTTSTSALKVRRSSSSGVITPTPIIRKRVS